MYYSFWTIEAYSGAASTFTLEAAPLEFAGRLYETLDSLGPLFTGYNNSWIIESSFEEGSKHIFACVW